MSRDGRRRPRLCFITAVPMTANAFLFSHLKRLGIDYELFLISNFADGIPVSLAEVATCIHIPIQRKISLWSDLVALLIMAQCMRRLRFDLVQSVTPKAGLLGMLAARLTGIQNRVHWYTGQVWATRRGMSRYLLKGADRLIAASASALLADSRSQRMFLLTEKVCLPGKLEVIADGSICGVDERFHPDALVRERVRKAYSIPADAIVCLYLGRLSRDKGMHELATAIPVVCSAMQQVHFMVVGPDEDGLLNLFTALVDTYPGRIHIAGHTSLPDEYMMAADLFCLPSYREGFGSVVIEAAATGLPAVASRIYGLVDAVEDEVTGLLVPAHDSQSLALAIIRLCRDQPLREQMGRAAELRATTVFARNRIVTGLADFYARQLHHV